MDKQKDGAEVTTLFKHHFLSIRLPQSLDANHFTEKEEKGFRHLGSKIWLAIAGYGICKKHGRIFGVGALTVTLHHGRPLMAGVFPAITVSSQGAASQSAEMNTRLDIKVSRSMIVNDKESQVKEDDINPPQTYAEKNDEIRLCEDAIKVSRLAKWSRFTGRNVPAKSAVRRVKGLTAHVGIHPSKVTLIRLRLDKAAATGAGHGGGTGADGPVDTAVAAAAGPGPGGGTSADAPVVAAIATGPGCGGGTGADGPVRVADGADSSPESLDSVRLAEHKANTKSCLISLKNAD
ncbi:hypothetical protein A6R68_13173, partial [Neotoma lepida]